MSILSELKKLTGKSNAIVISEALPDSNGGDSDTFKIHISEVDGNFESIETYDDAMAAYTAGRKLAFYLNGSFVGFGFVDAEVITCPIPKVRLNSFTMAAFMFDTLNVRLVALPLQLSPFVITFSGTTDGGDAACDKTYDEINEAFILGRPLQLKYDGGSNLKCDLISDHMLYGSSENLGKLTGSFVQCDLVDGSPVIKKMLCCSIQRNGLVAVKRQWM